MIKTLLCCVAEGIVVDEKKKTLSIFNQIEQLQVGDFPAFVQKLGFVALLERASTDINLHTGTFTVQLGDQPVVTEAAVAVDFQKAPRTRVIINFSGLIIPQSGKLVFKLAFPDGAIAETYVDVQSLAAP